MVDGNKRDREVRRNLVHLIKNRAKKRDRVREVLCKDYLRLVNRGMSDADARAEIIRKREVTPLVLKNALEKHGNNMNPKAAAEIDGGIMVLQEKQIGIVTAGLADMERVVNEVLQSKETHFELERTETEAERTGLSKTVKSVPKNEYLMLLVNRKLRAVREALAPLAAFRKDKDVNVNVGVAINQEDRENRLKSALDKFKVKVDSGSVGENGG